MAKIATVWVWGSPIPSRYSGVRADHAALVNAVTAPAELYSERLRLLGVEAPRSQIRAFVREEEFATSPVFPEAWRWKDTPEGRVGALDAKDSFLALALIPMSGFTRLSPAERAATGLELLHAATVVLAGIFELDPAPFEEARTAAVEAGLEFGWSSKPKSAPDRRRKARLAARIDLEGEATARLEIVEVGGDLVSSSDWYPSAATVESFRRSATSLHWLDRLEAQVEVEAPWPDRGTRRLTVLARSSSTGG